MTGDEEREATRGDDSVGGVRIYRNTYYKGMLWRVVHVIMVIVSFATLLSSTCDSLDVFYFLTTFKQVVFFN